VTIAVTPRRYDQISGQWIDGTPTYVDTSVWGDQAEHVADPIRKGNRVIVLGRWSAARTPPAARSGASSRSPSMRSARRSAGRPAPDEGPRQVRPAGGSRPDRAALATAREWALDTVLTGASHTHRIRDRRPRLVAQSR
jgi:hypothetical protein